MRLRFRDLLVWRTGGMIANAAVMGLVGRFRYVLLSDGLLENLEEGEVRAIFAHEAGHIVSHHLFYALLFAVSSVALCGMAGEAVSAWLDLSDWAGETLTLLMLGGAWGVGFGFLSRRFERQSDVIAAWSSGPEGPRPDGRISPEGAAVFCRALERVGQLNGIPPGQWNWRHGSIAARVAYIMWLGSTAGSRAAIDRVVRRIKVVLWCTTALAGILVAIRLAAGF
ncbi:MAG: M48 family metalloprotease, partial [Planctomycetes bacterium]|nr:M48 family metalloprotease [Planctomycetota bacterium]